MQEFRTQHTFKNLPVEIIWNVMRDKTGILTKIAPGKLFFGKTVSRNFNERFFEVLAYLVFDDPHRKTTIFT